MLIIRINTGNLRFYYTQCVEYDIASNYAIDGANGKTVTKRSTNLIKMIMSPTYKLTILLETNIFCYWGVRYDNQIKVHAYTAIMLH